MSIRILPEGEIVKKAGEFYTPPLLFANPKNLYQRRAERLKKLAETSPFADYLLFASVIVEAQLKVLENQPLAKDTISKDTVTEEYPLDYKQWQRSPSWREFLTALLIEIKNSTDNSKALEAIEWLEKASQSELEALADHLLAANYTQVPADRAVFIWAALSLYWVQLAQQIPHNANAETSDNLHVCPVCRSAPTSSVVHFGASQGLRYLHCSLCESEWNLVRSKCSNCGESRDLNYWSLDQELAPVKAETCGSCGGYVKILYQERDPHVEAVTDDLASLFLDAEMEAKDFSRSAINPFLFPSE